MSKRDVFERGRLIMKISELAEKLDLRVAAGADGLENQAEAVISAIS